MQVKFKNLTKEKLTGTVNMATGEFALDDVVENGILDGSYKGYFEDDFKVAKGVYENYKTKKQVTFTLTRISK